MPMQHGANQQRQTGEPADQGRSNAGGHHLNKFAGVVANNFKFSVDETSGQVVVKVIDSRTNECCGRFPMRSTRIVRSFDTTTDY